MSRGLAILWMHVQPFYRETSFFMSLPNAPGTISSEVSVMGVKPRKIRLEASTACQLHCPTCPTGVGRTQERLGVGHLRFADFSRLIDDNPFLTDVELSNWGEIFLDPELPSIVEHAYRRRVRLHADVGVNLNTLREETLESLVRYRFRSMSCSIDGTSEATYGSYRRDGSFEAVIGNIRRINEAKARHRTRFPHLKWQFIVFAHNQHEIPRARRLASELGMRFWLKLPWDDLYATGNAPPPGGDGVAKREMGLGVASRDEFAARYGERYAQKIMCSLLWHEPQINWDGRVLGCCVNHWGDFGNAFSEGLVPSLNGDRIRHARSTLTGRLPIRHDVPCATCPHFRSMERAQDWLTFGDLLTAGFLLRHRVALQDDRLRPALRPLLGLRKGVRALARFRS